MADYSREVYLAWLASAGLAPETLRELLEETHGNPCPILEEVRGGSRAPFGVALPEKAAGTLKKNGAEKYLETWARLTEKHGIGVLVFGEEGYPEALTVLEDAPAFLFYRGNPLALLSRSAAVVGSRDATWKGLEATERIAENLSKNAVAVVSGLAYGIDAAAHKGCLKGGAPTVAVLGCGVDQDYPAENASLRRKILEEGGLILSEFAPGEKPLGWHFPFRNRIISGLSDCLIVMEARIRSGSMTTVQHALSQGKDVFVFPGEAGNPRCEGNHQLLREGAIYFTRAEDILEDMRWLDKKEEVGQNSVCTSSPEALPPEERAVLDRLSPGERSFEQLCAETGLAAPVLMSTLTMMQIRGLIEAMPGKFYRIKQK